MAGGSCITDAHSAKLEVHSSHSNNVRVLCHQAKTADVDRIGLGVRGGGVVCLQLPQQTTTPQVRGKAIHTAAGP